MTRATTTETPRLMRARVAAAMTGLGWVPGAPSGELAPHWRRNNFGGRVFQPAVTGRYPGKVPRPVPVSGEPWPGRVVRDRNADARADACWAPIAPGLTPHGLRHSYKTVMDELGTPHKLMDQQMGHSDGSIQAVYSHVTAPMVERLLAGLTDMWHAALDARLSIAPRSPVAALDRLLAARREAGEQ